MIMKNLFEFYEDETSYKSHSKDPIFELLKDSSREYLIGDLVYYEPIEDQIVFGFQNCRYIEGTVFKRVIDLEDDCCTVVIIVNKSCLD